MQFRYRVHNNRKPNFQVSVKFIIINSIFTERMNVNTQNLDYKSLRGFRKNNVDPHNNNGGTGL